MKAVLQEAENAKNINVWVNLCICLQILWVFLKPQGDAYGHFTTSQDKNHHKKTWVAVVLDTYFAPSVFS